MWKWLFLIIGEIYIRMIYVTKQQGYFHSGIRNALLSILKEDNTNYNTGSLKNFRPLSLMNVDYKIISKVLSLRLRKVLNSIIQLDQSCGLLGGSIIEHHSKIREPIGIIQWD